MQQVNYDATHALQVQADTNRALGLGGTWPIPCVPGQNPADGYSVPSPAGTFSSQNGPTPAGASQERMAVAQVVHDLGFSPAAPVPDSRPDENKIITRLNYRGSSLRVVRDTDGKVWFVTKDLSEAIGYKWRSLNQLAPIPKECKALRAIMTNRGWQLTSVLSKEGVIAFMLARTQLKAVDFLAWFRSDVVQLVDGWARGEAQEDANASQKGEALAIPAGTYQGQDKPVQPQDSRVIQFPTVGKYALVDDMAVAQVSHDLGFAPPPAKQGNIFRDPPFYSAYDAEYVAPAPMAEMAPSSPERVEDKNQALQFAFEDKTVRTIFGQDREPWFAARDVCAVLGYSDPDQAVRAHCKYAKLFRPVEITGLEINPRGMMFINEPDLYRLIMKSSKPAAERFERMVMEEILPSIRKHGGYLTPQATEEALADPDFIIGLATKLKEERARAAELEAQKAKLAQEKIALAEANMALKPKADLHDSLMEAGGAIEMGEAAKVLCRDYPGVGRNKLFHFLRWAGVLMYNDKRYNVPTQRFMNRGFFRVAMKTRDFLNRDYAYPQVYVKPEGMEYIHKLVGKYYDGNTLRYLDTKAA